MYSDSTCLYCFIDSKHFGEKEMNYSVFFYSTVIAASFEGPLDSQVILLAKNDFQCC